MVDMVHCHYPVVSNAPQRHVRQHERILASLHGASHEELIANIEETARVLEKYWKVTQSYLESDELVEHAKRDSGPYHGMLSF